MANSIATPLRWLLLVAVAIGLCMAAGASAQPSCLTDEDSAVYSDAEEALTQLRLQGKGKLCQTNCQEDNGCTVVVEYQTAQLKVCGYCGACEGYIMADYCFASVLHSCREYMVDGTYRTSGRMIGDYLETVIDGKGQNVDAGIQMKLSK